ncbi:MAG: hypothetical protein NTX64_07650 [Elusimicrobia bacterium]|nr:hypothetical protein [Elusimicrobiota bacterium]
MTPPSLKREFARKAWHLLLLLYLVVYWAAGRELFVRAMAAWVLIVFAVETLRLRVPAVQKTLLAPFALIIREREHGTYSGIFYTSVGIFLAAALFGADARVVAAAVFSLAFADSSAALVGMSVGRLRFVIRGQVRTVEGTTAGFAAALVCGRACGLPGPAALAAACAVAVVDCLPLPPDDNLWIPVASAAAATAALRLL